MKNHWIPKHFFLRFLVDTRPDSARYIYSSRSLSDCFLLQFCKLPPPALSCELFPALVSRFRLVACHARRAVEHFKSSASFRHMKTMRSSSMTSLRVTESVKNPARHTPPALHQSHLGLISRDVTRGCRVRETPQDAHLPLYTSPSSAHSMTLLGVTESVKNPARSVLFLTALSMYNAQQRNATAIAAAFHPTNLQTKASE